MSAAVFGQNGQVKSVNSITYASLLDKVRITISCSGTPSVSAFTLSAPERIVLDLIDTRVSLENTEIKSVLPPVRMIQTS
jgi:hypothetical protein